MPYADGSSRQGWRARVGRIALEAWGNFGDKLTLEERDRESGYEWNDLPQNRMMDTRVGPEWGPSAVRRLRPGRSSGPAGASLAVGAAPKAS